MSHTTTLLPYRFLKLPNQTKIAYLEAGPPAAPVILFLHGLGDTAQVWQPAMAALQTHFRCLAIDLPGHGHSQAPAPFGYEMFSYADMVETFLKQLEISSFFLAGHSMGGQIAVILALRLPALVEKLVLVAPAGFERFTGYEKKMLELGASFGNGWNQPPGQTDQDADAKQVTMQRSLTGMLSEPVFDFLPQLTVPALVIFGEHDAFIPNRYLHHNQTTAAIARDGASQIPGAELLLFSRCNHYPQVEQPQKFVKSVAGFLKKGL